MTIREEISREEFSDQIKSAFADVKPSQELMSRLNDKNRKKRKIRYSSIKIAAAAAAVFIIGGSAVYAASEMNFIDSEWCPKYNPIDTIKYYIDDPFFDEDLVGLSWYSLIGLGCGLTYKSKYTESLYIDPISKLKNSEYIEFDNESGCGEFTIYFSPRYKLPVLEINWDSGSYIGLNYDAYAPTSDVCTLIGEVEVATFYQILKIYKQFIDSI